MGERCDLPLSINYQQVRVVLAYHPVRLDLKGIKKHDCKAKSVLLTLNFREKKQKHSGKRENLKKTAISYDVKCPQERFSICIPS